MDGTWHTLFFGTPVAIAISRAVQCPYACGRRIAALGLGADLWHKRRAGASTAVALVAYAPAAILCVERAVVRSVPAVWWLICGAYLGAVAAPTRRMRFARVTPAALVAPAAPLAGALGIGPAPACTPSAGEMGLRTAGSSSPRTPT